MTTLVVPTLDDEPWPTLGPQVVAWIEENLVYGPGDLRGQRYRVAPDFAAWLYRAYEVFPPDHARAGKRRFKRVAISERKGLAKTEKAAILAAVESHPDGPVRCDGFDANGQPVGRSVSDPYIPLVAYTQEQTEELAFNALHVILSESSVADDYDIGLERILVIGDRGRAAGKIVALAGSPNARDGARTTWQHFDEPLALGTPIPTPSGWTMMADVSPGDYVIGRDGRPALVVGVSPVHVGRPCFRVTFADGVEVVADAAHRWSAIDRRSSHKGYGVVTTETMAEEVLITEWDCCSVARWAVPMADPVDLPQQSLPIDPYVLGLWLGDGDASNATIAQGDADLAEVVDLLAERGVSVTECARTEGKAARIYVHDLRSKLRVAGLLGAKSVPPRYLRASIQQRLDLLRGLMDSDGHATVGGWCTFVNTSELIVNATVELLRTLGHRPTVCWYPDHRSRVGGAYKVGFQGDPDLNPFTLVRKAARCQVKKRRQHNRSIVSIEPVDSVPVRCIAVDTSDHLFLAGDGMVVTHNTHRFTLDSLKRAHRTMLANIPKRPMADPWSLETTTAFTPGEASVAEATMDYAKQIEAGRVRDPRLFFFHRQAGDNHDLATHEGRLAAVEEASGPAAEWSDIDTIASQWDEPDADSNYLERVWLNRARPSTAQAFDVEHWRTLRSDEGIAWRSKVTLGFDGSRFHDTTALVATDLLSGFQQLVGFWDPRNYPEHEIPEAEVNDVVTEAFRKWKVLRFYADPPYWETAVDQWAGRHGSKKVAKWWTNRPRPMAFALAAYANAIKSRELTHDGDPRFAEHVGNAWRHELNLVDDQGKPLWVIRKERSDSPNKIDAAMAACLSWEARRDCVAAGMAKKQISAGW